MKKKRWLRRIIVLLVLLAAVFVVFVMPSLRSASNALYSSEQVVRGDISTYYSFAGSIELARQESHAAMTACEVRDVYVHEGDMVKKDDRLLRLSDGQIIKAGIDGEVTGLDVSKDDSVSAGQLLAEIADMSSMRVEFDVDEFDVGAVSIGGDAHVTIDALDYSFTAPVTRLSKTAHTVGDITYYTARVETDVNALPAAVLPGMRVDVKVLGAHAEGVLMIKIDSLSFDEYNQPYVLVQQGEDKVRRYVTTGVNDGVYVEIADGLAEGDTVYAIKLSAIEELMNMRGGMASGSR